MVVILEKHKPTSFYDWEQELEGKGEIKKNKEKDKKNRLGIPQDEFERFCKRWRKKNLSFKYGRQE
jgi:hypothetical protein